MDTIIVFAIIFLITSVPAAYFLNYLTKDEKNLISYYFPSLLWIFALLSAIFYTINPRYGFITTYLFITMFIWSRLSRKD